MTAPTTAAELLRTPLHAYHLERGAKMVDFAGWEMPLHYGSILDEHHQVRESGGIFDVSHMGRFEIRGRDACRFLDMVCTRQVAGMGDGQARYSLVCNAEGGCRDDVLVYRMGDGDYFMVCNASNRLKLLDHFAQVKGDLVFSLKDVTQSTAMVAVQGPKVMDLVSKYSNEIPQLKRYRFTKKNILGLEVIVSRTGYTGEDGVEVVFGTGNPLARAALGMLMKELSSVGDVLKPCGLGARDSLRLEAAMALYGHEIEEHLDPVSANLDFAMKLDKGDDDPSIGRFIGQDALRRIKADGPARRLAGLKLEGRRAARQHMKVLHDGAEAGVVTSGCVSPTLDQSIAMAYVDVAHSAPGTALAVDLGRQTVPCVVVALPFYKA